MEINNVKKRFIAGAVCPKCSQIDKIVVYSLAGKQFAECVRCHYRYEAQDEKLKKKQQGKEKKIIWIKNETI